MATHNRHSKPRINEILTPQTFHSFRAHGAQSLTGTLAHLPPLTTKTTHPLLAPLGTHTGGDLEHHLELLILLDSVSGEGSSGELLGSGDEADEVGGDELGVLDHGLEVGDGGGAFHFVGRRGAGGGGDDDLHCWRRCWLVYLGCSEPGKVGGEEGIYKKIDGFKN